MCLSIKILILILGKEGSNGGDFDFDFSWKAGRTWPMPRNRSVPWMDVQGTKDLSVGHLVSRFWFQMKDSMLERTAVVQSQGSSSSYRIRQTSSATLCATQSVSYCRRVYRTPHNALFWNTFSECFLLQESAHTLHCTTTPLEWERK